MKAEIIPYGGWERNLLLTNGDARLLVTLDVGPRVLDYRAEGQENVFNVFSEMLGGRGEAEWMIRGGHRFWFAPEGGDRSFCPDNEPVEHEFDAATRTARITWIQPRPEILQKVISLQMAESGCGVKVEHRATNVGEAPVELAPWALSVMVAGGTALIPQPPLGEHPRDFLPNRKMIVWPYVNLQDPRLTLGPKFWRMRHEAGTKALKFGLAHREGWAAYAVHGGLFVKASGYEEGAVYADDGCNCEVFTDGRILEVESLGPLVTLEPGETVSHAETWNLISGCGDPPADDDALAEWIAPLLRGIGL